MADTIKISDRMAEALVHTLRTDDGKENRLALSTRSGTVAALMDRGLVRYDRERTRENGYEVHPLTPRGLNVRERLFAQPGAREFLVWAVDAAARKVTAPVATETRTRETDMTRKNIRITPKMVEALENTIEINGRQAMIMSHPKTQAALADRKLADEHGYLTCEGKFVAHLISLGTTDRAWSQEELEAGTRTWLNDQRRHAEAAKPKAVGDVLVPPADFRVAATEPVAHTLEDVEFDSDAADREEARRETSAVECECGAQWPTGVMGEGHNDMDCTTASQRKAPAVTERACTERNPGPGPNYACTVTGPHDLHQAYGLSTEAYASWSTTKPVTEYSVKIWYRSGAYEGVAHSPEDLARKIFADAVESAGVEFAELHGPSGMLVESKPPALDYRDAACVAGDED